MDIGQVTGRVPREKITKDPFQPFDQKDMSNIRYLSQYQYLT